MDILKNNGLGNNKELLEVVRYNHNKKLDIDNKYLRIIKICDNKNI